MAVFSNQSVAPIDLAASATDTVLIAAVATTSRLAINAFSLFNTTASTTITVDLYQSPDATSASGKKIATYTFDGSTSVQVIELIGQGLSAGQNIIGRVTTGAIVLGDVNCKRTTTLYTANS